MHSNPGREPMSKILHGREPEGRGGAAHFFPLPRAPPRGFPSSCRSLGHLAPCTWLFLFPDSPTSCCSFPPSPLPLSHRICTLLSLVWVLLRGREAAWLCPHHHPAGDPGVYWGGEGHTHTLCPSASTSNTHISQALLNASARSTHTHVHMHKHTHPRPRPSSPVPAIEAAAVPAWD